MKGTRKTEGTAARYRVVNGCNHKHPNPTPDETAAARAQGHRWPFMRREIGDVIAASDVTPEIIASLIDNGCIEPIEEPSSAAPAAGAGE